MIWRTIRSPVRRWRAVAPFIGASGWRVGLIVLASIARALSEALVIVLVARLALAISDGAGALPLGAGFSDFTITTGQAVLVCLGCTFAMLLLSGALAHLGATMSSVAVRTTRQQILASFLSASWDLQARERAGHLQELLTSYAGRVAAALSVLTLGLTASISLIALVLTAVVANALTAGAMLVSVGVIMALMRPFAGMTRERSRRHGRANARFATLVTETVGCTEEIRVFGVRDEAEARLARANLQAERTAYSVFFLRKLVPGIYQSAGLALIVLALGAVTVWRPGDLSALAVVVLLFVRAMAYGQQLQSVIHQANEALPHLQELRGQEARYLRARLPEGGRPVDRIGQIEIRGVHYAYEAGPEALHDVSCRIESGEMIGIVGPSGSGKSTLVQLLLRLRAPTSGVLLVNEEPVDSFSLQSWYNRVAIVPQRPQLIEATIAENISFFREVDDDQIRTAAERAHIHDEVIARPGGYQAMIRGSHGSVSGGQAQRLSLARALVGSPDLLVLDEPTSALDVRSDAAVQQALGSMKGEVTMVVIAHRLSTLRLCDRVMVLEDGRIQAFDEASKLLESEGFYREAFELSRL